MVIEIIHHEAGEIIEWKWASDNKLIPSPFFASVYYIDGILIDAGAPGGVDDFREFIHSLLKTYKIKMCAITHRHEDHCGGAYILQEEFNIPIYAPKEAIPILKNESTYPEYRQMTWGDKRFPVNAKKLPHSITSISGKYEFEIFPMQGHAPDQNILIEKKKGWIFAADAIQPKYKMIFGGNSDIQEDISLIYDSISKLYQYTVGMENIKLFLSGRGLYEGRDFLKKKMKEIENLHKKVHLSYEAESKKYNNESLILKKILKSIFKREDVIGKLTQEDLSIMNLIKSLLKWPLSDQ